MTGRVSRTICRCVLAFALVLGFVFMVHSTPAEGQTFKALYSFQDGLDGAYPYGGIALDAQGNLYGMTSTGGSYAAGVVFKLKPSGREKVLYTFQFRQGASPMDAPLIDAAGTLYGTTAMGSGGGTLVELARGGRLKVLHQFARNGTLDGDEPYAGVVEDAMGNLYGTTPFGGCCGQGTVYKIAPNGAETILHNFTGSPDGWEPYGGLTIDAAGDIYGTTILGGTHGYGTVFKVDSAGNETVLYSFSGVDGEQPAAGLVQDAQGNLYGTTYGGGAYRGGVVFKVDPPGTFTLLHSFGEFSGDGSLPYAGVVIDAQGNLYGTTSAGGAFFDGSVYKLDTIGIVSILHSFAGGTDGLFPYAGVTLDPAGNLYGTTVYGGTYGYGVVYKISP